MKGNASGFCYLYCFLTQPNLELEQLKSRIQFHAGQDGEYALCTVNQNQNPLTIKMVSSSVTAAKDLMLAQTWAAIIYKC